MPNAASSKAHSETTPESDESHYHPHEVVHALTHGAGFLLAIVGAIVLSLCTFSSGDVWRIIGCGIFATTLIAVYAFSTLSHCPFKPELKGMFERLDEGFIYLLIAGTYTSFGLVYLNSGAWWILLGMMWALALFGFIGKIWFPERIKGVAVWTYIFLGWLPIVAAIPLIEKTSLLAMFWMLTGGLCYTFGTAFLIWDNQRYRFHAIWHMFVIAGSTCHYFTILFVVACPPSTP